LVILIYAYEDFDFFRSLVIGDKNTSILNNPIPFEALLVKKKAKGTITMVDIQDPTTALNELSSAKFLPNVFAKK
jgi:hypothetical protein